MAEDQPDAQSTITSLSSEEKSFLLQLARRTLEQYLRYGRLPHVRPEELSPGLLVPARCFVTLRENGELRGCVGSMVASEPLYVAVMQSAIAAAIRDTRFYPVDASELPDIVIEISVLSPPRRLHFNGIDELKSLLVPGVHGVVLRNGPLSAVYLPEVWEVFADKADPKEAFLTSLSHKAGDPTGRLWTRRDTTVEVFEAVSFSEAAPGIA
ncbi:MAG: AmmeMemoRadiSam system protein A [Chthonomonadales bacterium]